MSQPERPPFSFSVLRSVLKGVRLPWDWIRRTPDAIEPTPDRETESENRDKLRVQVGVIRKAFDSDVAVAATDGSGPAEDDADAAYLYRPSHVLVRDEETYRRLETFFEDPARGDTYEGSPRRDPDRAAEAGILVRLPSRTDGRDDVLATLDEIEDVFIREAEADGLPRPDDRDRPLVTPDHVLYVTYTRPGLCPATEPEMVRANRPWPDQNPDPSAGDGVRVAVVDTGLWMPAVTSSTTSWMDGVSPASSADVENVNPAAIHEYAGHGTFVSGVVQCLAPKSVVEVEGLLANGGAVYESAIVEQLHQALEERQHPQLISISAGTHTRRNMALLGFELLAAAHGLDDGEDTVVVAAAGNDGSDDPFWPAAFPWVVGVGSVDPDGSLSDYSNYGPWVDVYARGRDLVNAFPEGTYTCHEPPHKGEVRHFKGMARWSGTSFSTPIVTGLIAAEMSASGTNALQAKATVLKSATPMNGLPVVGPLT